MNILRMIGKRAVQSIITIILVTMLVFLLIQLVPGNPVANYLGATASEEQIRAITQAVMERLRKG